MKRYRAGCDDCGANVTLDEPEQAWAWVEDHGTTCAEALGNRPADLIAAALERAKADDTLRCPAGACDWTREVKGNELPGFLPSILEVHMTRPDH